MKRWRERRQIIISRFSDFFQSLFLSRMFFVFLVFILNIWVLCFEFARELEEKKRDRCIVILLILSLCISGLLSEVSWKVRVQRLSVCLCKGFWAPFEGLILKRSVLYKAVKTPYSERVSSVWLKSGCRPFLGRTTIYLVSFTFSVFPILLHHVRFACIGDMFHVVC